MKLLLLLSAVPAFAQTLTYSKSFPGSVPAYVEIIVPETGDAEYRDDPKEDRPIRFAVPEADRAKLRELAEKLAKFTRPLESPAKVANMGMKTFRYQLGEERHEVKFNYSEDADARTLADWYESVIDTEQSRLDLETTARFEKLGVEKALLRIEALYDRKRLVAPEQLLPILDRIIRNESYMHMARARASGLAEHIRGTVK